MSQMYFVINMARSFLFLKFTCQVLKNLMKLWNLCVCVCLILVINPLFRKIPFSFGHSSNKNFLGAYLK